MCTYYLHYCALVCAIATLVSGNISEADLDMASILLKEFHCHAGDLYGKISDFAVDINTGILSTLVDCLRLLFISRYCYANNECLPTTCSMSETGGLYGPTHASGLKVQMVKSRSYFMGQETCHSK